MVKIYSKIDGKAYERISENELLEILDQGFARVYFEYQDHSIMNFNAPLIDCEFYSGGVSFIANREHFNIDFNDYSEIWVITNTSSEVRLKLVHGNYKDMFGFTNLKPSF